MPIAPEVGFFESDKRITTPEHISPAWRSSVRRELERLLQPRPLSSVPISVDTAAELELRPGVSILRLQFQAGDGHRLHGALLRPEGATGPLADAPLILALHGHGAGLRLLLDPDSYQKGIAVELARAGFDVLAVETRSFGTSGFPGLRHQPYVNRLRLQGREFHGQVLADNLEVLARAREILGHHGPLGVVGASLGGLSAMFLANFVDVEACLFSGIGGSWRNSFSSLPHCSCSIIPGLLETLDAEPILAASSCRHLALELGRQDSSLGEINLRDTLPQIRALESKSPVEIDIHIFDGGHEHDAPFVVDYFRRSFPRSPEKDGT